VTLEAVKNEGLAGDAQVSRASLAIAAFSTIVEWYDFTLYLYFATVLARVFFGPGEASLLVTLGGFAVAYLMRPLGAVFFGHIGDRSGRRHMLLVSVALMTAAMFATALLPTYAQVGSAAGVLLILLRCVRPFPLLFVQRVKQRGLVLRTLVNTPAPFASQADLPRKMVQGLVCRMP